MPDAEPPDAGTSTRSAVSGSWRRSGPPNATRPWLQAVPPRPTRLAGWALLALRAFLGVTFVVAGLQKLANPAFFDPKNPAGIQAQLLAGRRLSPLHALLGPLVHVATPLGVVIALGELAVGIGTLLGLWTRIAALGGMVLSLMLFFTVSFHASPYYTGADIVFVFAWTPLVVAGAGGVLCVDEHLARRARTEAGLAPGGYVAAPFALIQRGCGVCEEGRCGARQGAPCAPGPCPVLNGPTARREARGPADVRRRSLVLGAIAAALAAGGALLVAGLAAGIGRAMGGKSTTGGEAPALSLEPPPSPRGRAPSTTTTSAPPSTTRPTGAAPTTAPPTTAPPTTAAPTTTAPTTAPPSTASPATTVPPGSAIGLAADVPVGSARTFTDPGSGDPAIVLQPSSGQFVAFDAVCPHAGCTVGYSASADLLVCPCHGSEFSPTSGAVEAGPAPHGLRAISVSEGGNGELYAS